MIPEDMKWKVIAACCGIWAFVVFWFICIFKAGGRKKDEEAEQEGEEE